MTNFTPSQFPDPLEAHRRKIRLLNDLLRETFITGRVVLTSGIRSLTEQQQSEAITAVREFSNFTKDNDPHGEHDFGAILLKGGTKIFWKIDCFDKSMQWASANPANEAITARVLTIMLTDEW